MRPKEGVENSYAFILSDVQAEMIFVFCAAGT
jgi:hypothetical protein